LRQANKKLGRANKKRVPKRMRDELQ
jgi:hypothetical protein